MCDGVTSPLVSIICNTYNHVHYIRQCLDGFLMQKTDFPIEILVHDDASTDGTTDVVREYEAKFPHLIKPIYQTENQYSKGVKVSYVYQYFRARGKYMALCEGDDYWTDPLKLQKQVDFMEKNPEYVMCSHCFDVMLQRSGVLEKKESINDYAYSLKDLVNGIWPAQTLTVLLRSTVLTINKPFISGDVALFYFLLKCGPGMYLKDNMATYRIHDGGVWGGVLGVDRVRGAFDVRLSIYELERTDDAAKYILSVFKNPIPKGWYIKECKQFVRVLKILLKHFNPLIVLKYVIINYFS